MILCGPQKQKSIGFRSGESGGQAANPSRSVHRAENLLFGKCWTVAVKNVQRLHHVSTTSAAAANATFFPLEFAYGKYLKMMFWRCGTFLARKKRRQT
ncbi:hypothetical protein AVEN_247482-1 [Araneus ventricosus]|uniref:Uncharacterized protein n=1 Tax=Araneus ventricosus TaxID=182803 RepID=A0A4Y2GYJ4_ARAVE|nr:hypothetical protein AVEN_247482-1 [Araneus ventricosus]